MEKIIQKIILLKKEHFLEWPVLFQRGIVILVGVVCLSVLNMILFSDNRELIDSNEIKIKDLKMLLQNRKKLIENVNVYSASKKENSLYWTSQNFSYFMQYFSKLSKQNHLEIQSLKPLSSKYSEQKTALQETENKQEKLEVTAVGEYRNVVQFLSDISSTSIPAAMNDFEILRQEGHMAKLVVDFSLKT